MAGHTITPEGIGGLEALRVFSEVLAPACISIDHPRFLSFVPVGAHRGRHPVRPRRRRRRHVRRVVAGVVGRGLRRERGAALAGRPGRAARRRRAASSSRAARRRTSRRSSWPASVWRSAAPDRRRRAAAHRDLDRRPLLGAVRGAGDGRRRARGRGRRAGPGLTATRSRAGLAAPRRPRTVTGWSASSPPPARRTLGVVDDLAGIGAVAARAGHLVPRRRRVRRRRAGRCPASGRCSTGSSSADSFVVDPHKWLFAPFDCAALLYREPALARATHTQHAEYLDVVTETAELEPERLRLPPVPPGPRPAVLVLAGHARHRGLRRRRGDRLAARPRSRPS